MTVPVPTPASLRKHHWQMLAGSLLVIALSCLLTTENRQVALVGLSRFPLPDLCLSRLAFHSDCPGCGLTRSFIHIFHGRWHEAWQMHRLGWLLALITVLHIPYRLLALRTPQGLPLGKVFPQALLWGTAALLCANWLAKLAGY